MDDHPTSKKREIIAAVTVLIVIAGIIGTVVATNKKSTSSTASTPTSSSSSTSRNTATTSKNAASYKDGTYMATGSYDSPAGEETFSLSVTIANNVVTDTSATAKSDSPTGELYQQKFISGYKPLVVGKSVNDIKLSRVSGSSLTSQGFTNALDQIKSQAAA